MPPKCKKLIISNLDSNWTTPWKKHLMKAKVDQAQQPSNFLRCYHHLAWSKMSRLMTTQTHQREIESLSLKLRSNHSILLEFLIILELTTKSPTVNPTLMKIGILHSPSLILVILPSSPNKCSNNQEMEVWQKIQSIKWDLDPIFCSKEIKAFILSSLLEVNYQLNSTISWKGKKVWYQDLKTLSS